MKLQSDRMSWVNAVSIVPSGCHLSVALPFAEKAIEELETFIAQVRQHAALLKDGTDAS